ncbi:hypothetical protein ADIS_3708 [Lunatimonas lonarensis]|uniref:Uncharacterized protein n=1 Tax=Lunatimonas lonarensis TaxID=1232681 RepID=R7ZP07_9BACT|nr:hypothetical protein ADIS_3708 [Lunatimonas lonarensis]
MIITFYYVIKITRQHLKDHISWLIATPAYYGPVMAFRLWQARFRQTLR